MEDILSEELEARLLGVTAQSQHQSRGAEKTSDWTLILRDDTVVIGKLLEVDATRHKSITLLVDASITEQLPFDVVDVRLRGTSFFKRETSTITYKWKLTVISNTQCKLTVYLN